MSENSERLGKKIKKVERSERMIPLTFNPNYELLL